MKKLTKKDFVAVTAIVLTIIYLMFYAMVGDRDETDFFRTVMAVFGSFMLPVLFFLGIIKWMEWKKDEQEPSRLHVHGLPTNETQLGEIRMGLDKECVGVSCVALFDNGVWVETERKNQILSKNERIGMWLLLL